MESMPGVFSIYKAWLLDLAMMELESVCVCQPLQAIFKMIAIILLADFFR